MPRHCAVNSTSLEGVALGVLTERNGSLAMAGIDAAAVAMDVDTGAFYDVTVDVVAAQGSE